MVAETDTVKKAITEFANDWVTSAAGAKEETAVWHAQGGAGVTFGMFLLAADGYRYLGFGEDEIPKAANDDFNPDFADQYFLRGMKQQATLGRSYNDPPVSQWESPFQDTVHAMALLAHDRRDTLDQVVREVCKSFDGVFEVLTVERGDKLTFDFPRGKLTIEHFGFQDGVSQPIMTKQDLEKEVAARGNSHWDAGAPLSLTLVPEPSDGTSFGSFMVFRKLEQNVKAFWEALELLSKQHGIELEKAGAMATGRFRDGTPLVPTSTIDPDTDPNDFHYDQDPDGAKCPFHAHIRKTNPRGDVPRIIGAPAEFERARRIARRGITYGERPDLKDGSRNERPSEGVGLLFMCFQSTLDQFVIQQEGSDSNDFVRQGTGVDAVIGQNKAPVDQTWPSDGDAKFTMANFVKMLGGEYFFAPSIRFLSQLGDSDSED
jgi:Dyp-type peroxidase family